MLRRSTTRSVSGEREIEILGDLDIELRLLEGEGVDDILVDTARRATLINRDRYYEIGETRVIHREYSVRTDNRSYYTKLYLKVEKYAYARRDP